MADWQSLARRAARQVGVPPNLFVALVRQESTGRADALSPKGAIGYAQLMPDTARGLGVNPRDPWQNLIGGARYLKQQLHTFGGNIDKALAAYNAGPGAVQRFGGVPPYAETRHYVATIKANAGKISAPAGSRAPALRLGGSAGPGAPAAGSPLGIGPDTASGVDVSALLATLQGQQQRGHAPSSARLEAPSFSARPTLPADYQAPVSSGGPAPRQDIGALLSLVQTRGSSGTVSPLAGPETGQGTSQSAPQMPKGGSPGTAEAPTGKGTKNFEGSTVAAWIQPILQYARQQGWQGAVNSGFRSYAKQKAIYESGVRPAARPGTSNHEFTAYPGGAIDVSDAAQLSRILRRSKYRDLLVWAGSKDPVHFSHPHGGSY